MKKLHHHHYHHHYYIINLYEWHRHSLLSLSPVRHILILRRIIIMLRISKAKCLLHSGCRSESSNFHQKKRSKEELDVKKEAVSCLWQREEHFLQNKESHWVSRSFTGTWIYLVLIKWSSYFIISAKYGCCLCAVRDSYLLAYETGTLRWTF